MTEQTDREKAAELLRAKIRVAFPDARFSGPITEVDELLPDDERDEEQPLYDGLRGRKWSEIEASFVVSNVDGISLLTDEAYAAFLPAWLVAALEDDEVRELLVYGFSPVSQDGRMSESMARQMTEREDRRIRQLTSAQLEAILAFLTYCIEVETS